MEDKEGLELTFALSQQGQFVQCAVINSEQKEEVSKLSY